jgi:hypothetical protein
MYWLRHYATSRKVAGLKSDEVIEFYQLPSSFRQQKGQEFPQLLTEMGTRDAKKKYFEDSSAAGT